MLTGRMSTLEKFEEWKVVWLISIQHRGSQLFGTTFCKVSATTQNFSVNTEDFGKLMKGYEEEEGLMSQPQRKVFFQASS